MGGAPQPHPSARRSPLTALESALRLVDNAIRHRAALELDLRPVPPAFGNATRLGQVFVNLLMNAAQAIPDGRAEENRILVRTYALPDGQVGVEIEDTGTGIPMPGPHAHLEKPVEPELLLRVVAEMVNRRAPPVAGDE